MSDDIVSLKRDRFILLAIILVLGLCLMYVIHAGNALQRDCDARWSSALNDYLRQCEGSSYNGLPLNISVGGLNVGNED